MAEEKIIATGYIGNALRSTAADHTTTFTDEVFDTERQKYQSEVNTDIEERIEAEKNRAEAAEEANAQGIIYDVSAHNNGAVFESLSALLSSSDLDTLIPTSARHGGMSIRFIQSSDNKYVIYQLMANTFTTDVTQWQGISQEINALMSDFNAINITDDVYLNINGYAVNDTVNHSKSVLDFLPINNKVVKYLYSGRTGFSVSAICFYTDADQSTCIGSYLPSSPENIANKELSEIIQIPSTAKYVRFSSLTIGGAIPFKIQIINTDYLYKKVKEISQNTDVLQDDITELQNEVSKEDEPSQNIPVNAEENGYYNAQMYFVGGNGYCKTTIVIPCKEGDMFRYKGTGGSSYPSVFMFAGAATAGSVYKADYYSANDFVNIVIPQGVTNVVFQSWKYKSGEEVLSVIKFESKSNALTQRLNRVENSNILFNKTLVCCGDSFTKGYFDGYTDKDGHTGIESDAWDANGEEYDWTGSQWEYRIGCYRTYGYHIAKRNQMIFYNGGISGSTLAGGNNGYVPFSGNRYNNIPSSADYILIWFGINDNGRSIPVGTINDNDNTTFYGAWNVVLSYIIEHYPLAKIGIVVTNYSSSDYRNATIASAKKWGIPYLDIMGDVQVPLINGGKDSSIGLSDTAKNIRDSQFCINTPSNVHPTPSCHEYESTFIENWLRSL